MPAAGAGCAGGPAPACCLSISPVDGRGEPIDLRLTLDGGQTFLWWQRPGGQGPVVLEGLLAGHRVELAVDPHLPPGALRAADPSAARLAGPLRRLLDLDRDYRALRRRLVQAHPALAGVVAATPGLRIVRVSPWEALLSFLLSSHTHIPRIKGMLDALVRRFGPDGRGLPPPGALAAAGEPALRSAGLGYRARYLHRTATLLAADPARLARWGRLPTGALREQLLALPGVGPKVADCVLLFGYGRWDVFPLDRWVHRAVEALYFEGRRVPPARARREMEARFGDLAGLAQAHLFAFWRQRGSGAGARAAAPGQRTAR